MKKTIAQAQTARNFFRLPEKSLFFFLFRDRSKDWRHEGDDDLGDRGAQTPKEVRPAGVPDHHLAEERRVQNRHDHGGERRIRDVVARPAEDFATADRSFSGIRIRPGGLRRFRWCRGWEVGHGVGVPPAQGPQGDSGALRGRRTQWASPPAAARHRKNWSTDGSGVRRLGRSADWKAGATTAAGHRAFPADAADAMQAPVCTGSCSVLGPPGSRIIPRIRRSDSWDPSGGRPRTWLEGGIPSRALEREPQSFQIIQPAVHYVNWTWSMFLVYKVEFLGENASTLGFLRAKTPSNAFRSSALKPAESSQCGISSKNAGSPIS